MGWVVLSKVPCGSENPKERRIMEWYFAQFYHDATISAHGAQFLGLIQILLIFVAQGLNWNGAIEAPVKPVTNTNGD